MRPVALAMLLSGCCVGGLSSSDCETVIDKIIVCDPTAAGVARSTLSLQCMGTAQRCVDLPIGTPEQCTAFMGCLYDG